MLQRIRPAARALLLMVLSASIVGCRSAASARVETAAPAMVLSDQSYEAELSGTLRAINGRVRRVLTKMGLQVTERPVEDAAREGSYEGLGPDRRVRVEVRQLASQTVRVSVSSARVTMTRSGVLEADPAFARTVLESIHRVD